MKLKLATFAASGLILSAALATPAAADPGKGSATNVVEFCQATQDGGPLPNSGGCTSFFRSDDEAAAICKQWKDFGVLELFGFETQGECVRTLTQD